MLETEESISEIDGHEIMQEASEISGRVINSRAVFESPFLHLPEYFLFNWLSFSEFNK